MPSGTQTSFGRYQVPESPSSLRRLHRPLAQATPQRLRTVDWEPPISVLDQEDLIEQGIQCSTFIPGATDVEALGSCTANATVYALSRLLAAYSFLTLTHCSDFSDTKSAEIWAIRFYHLCTTETGDNSQEWPPNDCGSSGPYIVQELQQMRLIKNDVIANNGQTIASLMQQEGLLVGMPWFNNWMTPDAHGFIDSAGVENDINSGLAGGHETYWSAIEDIAFDITGRVDLTKTICRARNSWSKSWGDNGSFRFRLSTFDQLVSYCDFRQLRTL
jgi:hypothetical protein